MKIYVIGAGAMGLLFGACLSKRHEVTLIGHTAEKMQKIADEGVTVIENDGTTAVYHPSARVGSDGMSPAELAVLFVKSGSSEAALEENKSIIGSNTLLMTLQNGMGHEELLCRYAEPERVLIGTTQQGSYLKNCHTLCHSGGGTTAFGAVKGGSEKYKYVADAFSACGLPCEVMDDIQRMIWNKLMINASSSVLSGVLQVNQGYVAENEEAWQTCKSLISEICDTAAAEGYFFDKESEYERIYNHLKNAPNGYTSIYSDLKSGRKTEVDRISGSVVKTAALHGINTPTQQRMVDTVHRMEREGIKYSKRH